MRLLERLTATRPGATINYQAPPPVPYPPAVRAAGTVRPAPNVAVARPQRWGTGRSGLAGITLEGFPTPPVLWDRSAAMSVPTISRARNLLVSAVSSLPFTHWRVNASEPAPTPERLGLLRWMERPDPHRTRQWQLAWTTDDLIFYQVAYWEVTERYAEGGYPSAFTRVEVADVHISTAGDVRIGGRAIRPDDLIQFLSPLEGLLENGWRAILTAIELEEAAARFAATELPAGVLQQVDGEELTDTEWDGLISSFEANRRAHGIAGLNRSLKYEAQTLDPDKLQLVAARSHQALELARLANVPPYLVGAPTGTGMTYQNAEQARGDLIDFGALPYIGCIEQTLSGPNVLPNRQVVALDTQAWLRSPFTPPKTEPAPPTPEVPADAV